MICDFCGHEIADCDVIEARDIRRIPAWCNHCGAFSNGKDGMRLPHLGICLAMDRSYAEAERLKEGPHFCNKPRGHGDEHHTLVSGHLIAWWPNTTGTPAERAYEFAKSFQLDMQRRSAGPDAIVYHLACLLKGKIEESDTYRDTCKYAQEAGTKLWNKVVRVKNLLRVAQPHLESHRNICGRDGFETEVPELDALCNEIEKEIGSLEDNVTEEDGRRVAERLGIDIEKWAKEIRAKVDAATKEEGNDGIKS